MRWQAKAAVQKVLSGLPRSEQLNHALQRRVGSGFPRGDEQFLLHFDEALKHVRAYERHGSGKPLEEVRAFEFGAGWDLIGPLTAWALGVGSQTVVDISAHVRWDLVEHTAGQLARHREELERRAGRELRWIAPGASIRSTAELREAFGIDYRAPLDARDTGLPAGTFDLASSTYTLEHIPAPDIAAILRECARLLAPDGVLSSSIDLQDHYSFADPRISPYNFLRHGDATWRLINCSLHHQNRLRARDHRELTEAAGFDVLAWEEQEPTATESEALAGLDLAPRFRRDYTAEELAPLSVDVVATAGTRATAPRTASAPSSRSAAPAGASGFVRASA